MTGRRLNSMIATVLATILVTAATASGAPPPKALTHQYPLGTQTLCCQSHSETAPAASRAPSGSPSSPTPKRPQAHKRARQHNSALDGLVIAGIALVLAIALLDWLAFRRSHRVEPRPRRKVPRPLLHLLTPIYRHDDERDAWVLRVFGTRSGPVLRPRDHRVPRRRDEDDRGSREEPGPPPLVLRRRSD